MKYQVSRLTVRPFAFILLISCLWLPTVSPASQDGWSKVAGEIERAITSAMSSYQKGKGSEAAEAVADAYFGIFEGEKANMEIALRRFISLKRATEMEKGFSELRKVLSRGGQSAEAERQAANLVRMVKEAAITLDGKGVALDAGMRR